MSLIQRHDKIDVVNSWLQFEISTVEFEAEVTAEGQRRKQK